MSIRTRISLGSIDKSSIYLATQFNDLSMSTFAPATFCNNRKLFLLELKRQALFHDITIIRDADIVNHVGIVEVAANNEQYFLNNLTELGHLFCIRDGFESYSEINELASNKRAFPGSYEEMKAPLKRLDTVLENIPVAEINLDKKSDLFLDHLRKGIDSPALYCKEKEDLAFSIDRALCKSCGGFVRFGDIYSVLINDRGYKETGNLVQFCRAAHSLIVPVSLGVNHLIANNDFDGMHLRVILGENGEPISVARQNLLPKKIIMDGGLETLSFSDIVRIRKKGREIGYFSALNRLCSCKDAKEKQIFFTDYMEKLSEYFVAMSMEGNVELHDWQRDVVYKRINDLTSRYDSLFFALPVLISGILISILPLPVGAITSVAANSLGNIAKSSYHNARQKTPLERLVNGSTVFPLANY